MPNVKHTIITMPRLQGALNDVYRELDSVGVFDQRLAKVEVYLTWFGKAFGWQYYRSSGHIEIPAISIGRLSERVFGDQRTTLRDILRHEFAHAVADQNRGLIRSRLFRAAFGSAHDTFIGSRYHSHHHVTRYAATAACEDFAEVFMFYLKHSQSLPKRFDTPVIRKKWIFVESLCQQIKGGNRRWSYSHS